MASAMAAKRLRKEYLAIQKNPIDHIITVPLDTNILDWHYVIIGTSGTPYEGGYYHGVLRFPPEYPMKPPSVKMLTPNGRFKTNQRLCLSMSDFHPETWNPMWSVSSILTGLYSFMIENQSTLGSIVTSDAEKRKYAANSLEYNCTSRTFRRLFPELVEKSCKKIEAVETKRSASPKATAEATESESVLSDESKKKSVKKSYIKRLFGDGTRFITCTAIAFGALAIIVYYSKLGL